MEALVGPQEYMVLNTAKVADYIDKEIGVDYEIESDPWTQKGSVTVFELEKEEHLGLRNFIDESELWMEDDNKDIEKHLSEDAIDVYHQVSGFISPKREELLLLKAAGDGFLGGVSANVNGDIYSSVVFNIGDAYIWETMTSPVDKQIAVARLEGVKFVEQQFFSNSFLEIFNKILEEKEEPLVDARELSAYFKRGTAHAEKYKPDFGSFVERFSQKINSWIEADAKMEDIFSVIQKTEKNTETEKETLKKSQETSKETAPNRKIEKKSTIKSVLEKNPVQPRISSKKVDELASIDKNLNGSKETPLFEEILDEVSMFVEKEDAPQEDCIFTLLGDEEDEDEDLLLDLAHANGKLFS